LLIPYDWSFDSSLASYTFQLKNGINYKVEIYTTGSLYFPNYSAIKNLLYEISVTPDQSPTRHDNRVSITIVDIIKSILDNGKIIMFICDSSDGKDKGRRKLFDNWFKKYGNGFEKYDNEILSDECNYYISLLFAVEHPDKKIILNAFEQAKDEYGSFKTP